MQPAAPHAAQTSAPNEPAPGSRLSTLDFLSGHGDEQRASMSSVRRTRASEPPIRQKRKVSCWLTGSRYIVETKVFVTITTILTIYALTGDDIRLLCTDQPADKIFDSLTLTCLIVFSVEIILCILGKDDYFLSFYFLLDVISTVTLVLDLSVVVDMIEGDDEELDNVRGSRTAKIGARAGRVVRVIRLVRILKLYKAVLAARQAKKRREIREANPGDEDDDWGDIDIDVQMAQLQTESRVGKKLSELTTRRVICLVLMMMLCLPYLQLDDASRFPTSATYGADTVYDAFKRMEETPGTPAFRTFYEQQLLQYIYYHNWFNSRLSACPYDRGCSRDYDSQIFWIGIVSKSASTTRTKAQSAKINKTSVQLFDEEAASVIASARSAWKYNYGTMPHQVQLSLGMPWDDDCPYQKGRKQRLGVSLLADLIPGRVSYAVRCPEGLRKVERKMYAPRWNINAAEFEDWHLAFYFDLRPFVQTESTYALLITVFVCLSLTSASLFFSNDANRLVLSPVENMISKVDMFRKDPLMAMKVADEEFKAEEMHKAKVRRQEQKKSQWLYDLITCKPRESTTEIMETVILEKTIVKLGSLLALGFGEAGANIIAQNMHGVDTASVNAMVEGTPVECIIGAVRIRDFSTATEVLQGRVMTFVNRIAEIVHGVVDEFHGAANKNSGDMFLMIWRTSDVQGERVSKLADMAILAFTRILGAVHRSPVLADYRSHPGLQQRLGKNCRVNLSSGLHYGWAIEGAVGSEFKIDASYLSPNVSIAESVERATQLYGVSLLAAESVVRVCTPAVAAKCRLIDRVVITGSQEPMELYAVDLDYMRLMVEPPPPVQVSWTPRQRFRVRQFLEAEKAMKWHDDVHMVTLFNESSDVAAMRFRYTLEFMHVFNMGYQNYSQGEWQVAQRLLSRTRTMLGVEDGPSVALLRFMETPCQFVAPESWKGYRELDHSALT